MNENIVKAEKIVKDFESGSQIIKVLNGVDFVLRSGEIIAVEGPSGSGKTTFLHILGTLERPSSGELFLAEKNVKEFSDRALSGLRNRSIGFVFQFHNLISELTAIENAMIPMLVAGKKKNEARQKAEEMLVKVGLSQRLNHHPSQLSGGEKQRVAIARALANSPKVVLADEPTGNLDAITASSVLNIFLELAKNDNCGVIIVTHNPGVSSKCDKILRLNQGILQ
ncbi:ABC transporter ATP-binding protein [candidate division WOR-3 bacterium]|nr:ABC transporter ATP-binding protein [candidate division WOR-3 bacterium]